jgi:hypothetical protein
MTRMLLALALALAATHPARATDGSVRRFALVAGASLGGPDRTPLRYATSDARAVSRVFRRLGGVALADLVLLEEPDPARIRASLATIGAAAARDRSAGRRVELFLYYSGHSDEDGLLLGSSRLPYGDLRRLLDEVPADVRVAILDSCASGAFTRTKGGVHRPPFLLDESSRVKGHAFLTSSAAHEAAQESDRLRASFFTHALVTGLRGAADASGDGLVTLNEAYQFAFRETLAGTEATQGGPQHATYDIGLVGSGDVVMTDLRSADALLVLPDALDGRVFVRNAAGHLVAELRKTRGTRIDLALEEGRYDVRVARADRVLAGQVDLAASGQTVLEEARLAPAEMEVTARRGPTDEPVPVRSQDASSVYWAAARGGPAISQGGSRGSHLGVGGELATGVWLRNVVAVELAAGYERISARTKGRLPGSFGSATVPTADADVDDVVTSIPAIFTLKLAPPVAPFRPYLLGGAGLFFTRIERTPSRSYAWLAPGVERLREDVVHVGLHAGVGAVLEMRQGFALLEARYTFARPHALQESVRLDAVRVGAGAGFRF